MKIKIKRVGTAWSFDDKAKGIQDEWLVKGCPEFFDEYQNKFNKNLDQLTVEYSDSPFIGWKVKFEIKESDDYGFWYEIIESKIGEFKNKKAWICPTTLKYFDNFPEYLYVSVNA